MNKALLVLAAAVGALALVGLSGDAQAARKKAKAASSAPAVEDGIGHPKSAYYHKKTRVYGYVGRRRIGGYSYGREDVINTYGLTRGLYGSVNSWRDPFVDRQTTAGPFDHGFFFDSGVAPRGGDSPYLH
jgi:hypothetical protein